MPYGVSAAVGNVYSNYNNDEFRSSPSSFVKIRHKDKRNRFRMCLAVRDVAYIKRLVDKFFYKSFDYN